MANSGAESSALPPLDGALLRRFSATRFGIGKTTILATVTVTLTTARFQTSAVNPMAMTATLASVAPSVGDLSSSKCLAIAGLAIAKLAHANLAIAYLAIA